MASRTALLHIRDLRGGRNGVDSPLLLEQDQCCEAVNVDWYQGLIGRKRRGARAVSLTGSGFSGTTGLVTLIRHLPTAIETDNELWALTSVGVPIGARLVKGVWSSIHLDNIIGYPAKAMGVSFNGKLFLAYQSSVDRLHVWDGTVIRVVGMNRATQPSVGTAAGTGLTGQRGYKLAYVTRSGTTVIRRSELSLAAALPIANAGGWVVTRGLAINEGETHWEVYASGAPSPSWDSGPYYLVATLPMATTSYTDTVPPASFPPSGATLWSPVGAYSVPASGKYLLVDEARLLVAGSWTDPTLVSRVWWTPILNDASGVGNDERISLNLNPFIDFDPGDGGEITGLGGPLFDSPYVFKFDRIYKMVRTGLSGSPYRPVTISKKCGAIRQQTIVQGEDETGNECLYFLSRRGPYRLGVNGLQYCGRDIEDLWSQVLLREASGERASGYGAHGIYHADLHQVWWWVNVVDGEDEPPTLKLVFDVKQGRFQPTEGVRRGWSQHLGPSASAFSSVLYSETVGATNSLSLKPYIGQAAGASVNLWCCDTLPMTDAGTPYQSYIRTRVELPGGSVAEHGGVIEGHLVAWPTNATLRFTTERDFGIEDRSAQVLIPASTVERVIVPIRDLGAASVAALQLWVGDPAAIESSWTLDELVLRVRREEDR